MVSAHDSAARSVYSSSSNTQQHGRFASRTSFYLYTALANTMYASYIDT